jgi:hypothetical protein
VERLKRAIPMLEPRNKCMSAALAQMGQQWAKKSNQEDLMK